MFRLSLILVCYRVLISVWFTINYITIVSIHCGVVSEYSVSAVMFYLRLVMVDTTEIVIECTAMSCVLSRGRAHTSSTM